MAWKSKFDQKSTSFKEDDKLHRDCDIAVLGYFGKITDCIELYNDPNANTECILCPKRRTTMRKIYQYTMVVKDKILQMHQSLAKVLHDTYGGVPPGSTILQPPKPRASTSRSPKDINEVISIVHLRTECELANMVKCKLINLK